MKKLSGSMLRAFVVATAMAAVPTILQASPHTLHRGIGLEPETLDPQGVKSAEAAGVVRDLYEGLTREGPAGEPMPGGAARWTVSGDGLVWQFHLRDDLQWCNGEPLHAEAFVAGLQRNFRPEAGASNPGRWLAIENADAVLAGDTEPETLGIFAPTEKLLEIRLVRPLPSLLHKLHHPSAYPAYTGKAAAGEGCPGGLASNGPYVLKRRDAYARIELVRNERYWDREAVAIPAVTWHVIEDEHAELRRFRAGELHVTGSVPPGRFAWLQENFADEFKVAPYFATYFFGLNLAREPLRDNRELRHALSWAIDRERLVERVTGNGELPAYSWTPPGLADYEPPVPEVLALPRAERIAKAREAYRAAGYDAERPLRLTLHYNSGAIHQRVAIAVAGMWREVLGAEIELEAIEWKVLLDRRRHGQMTVFRDGWAGDVIDPAAFADVMVSTSANNHYGFHDEAYDALVHAAARTSDPGRRAALFRAAEQRLLAAQPVIPVYHYVSKHLVSGAVGGWVANPLNHHLSRYLYFRERVDAPDE